MDYAEDILDCYQAEKVGYIYKNGAYLGTLPDKYFHHYEDGALWVDYNACQYLISVCGLPESMFSEPEEW